MGLEFIRLILSIALVRGDEQVVEAVVLRH